MLASYAYDSLGRRSSVTFGNGTVQTLTFDNADRLTTLANNVAGTAQDVSVTFTYNPANQISSQTRSNTAYAWNGHYNVDRSYTRDGLNRLLTAGLTVLGYDGRGNLTTSGSSTYSYNADNMMISAPGGVTMGWDPLGRMAQIASGSGTTRFGYDGINLIAEYNASNVLTRRYVHGPGTDDPIVWYEGAGTTDRRFLMADERGSIVSVTNASGAILAINSYDEYGIPGTNNIGRFQYTGQVWLPEVGLYHYKARMYSPTLGRFMQTDPIGYADGMNWYAYVSNDPVNYVDPLGLWGFGGDNSDGNDDIVVPGPKRGRKVDPCDKAENRHSPQCAPGRFPQEEFGPDIVVCGGGGTIIGGECRRPAPEEPSTLERVWECTVAQVGLGEVASGAAAASGANVIPTRGKPAGAVPGTSVASQAGSAVFGDTRVPGGVRLPSVTGWPQALGGSGVALRRTASLARFAGRAVPVVGWALLIYDGASIAHCTFTNG